LRLSGQFSRRQNDRLELDQGNCRSGLEYIQTKSDGQSIHRGGEDTISYAEN
jgi:hypothetical protein